MAVNLPCDPTGVLWSAVKDGGGWRDGDHHRGGAASPLAAGGETADPGRVGRAGGEVRRCGAPERGEPRPAVAMAGRATARDVGGGGGDLRAGARRAGV